MHDLSGVRVAILATDGVEESELTEPLKALRDAGAHVEVVAPREGEILTFRHFDKAYPVPVDRSLEALEIDAVDALVLPGGALNADVLRMEPRVRELIRAMMRQGRPVAAICHAPWELISAGVIRGRKLTSYWTLQDDVRNAGGVWGDVEVQVDGNLVTSRKPADLPAFIREMLRLFAGASPGEAAEARPAERPRRRLGSRPSRAKRRTTRGRKR